MIILKRPTFVPLNLIPALTTAISEKSKRNSGSCYGWTYIDQQANMNYKGCCVSKYSTGNYFSSLISLTLARGWA